MALHVDDSWPHLAGVDVLISSTAARHPIVTRAVVEPALAGRRDRPLCVFDIALPRDVDPDVGDARQCVPVRSRRFARHDCGQPRGAALGAPVCGGSIAEEVDQYWEWVAGLVGWCRS